jgi:hypothetical protein
MLDKPFIRTLFGSFKSERGGQTRRHGTSPSLLAAWLAFLEDEPLGAVRAMALIDTCIVHFTRIRKGIVKGIRSLV